MELSILISMYNAEAYVSRCLDSVLNQDLSPTAYEILIMNDGSTDGSYDIVKEYAQDHPNVKLFQQKNSGNFSARNALLLEAKGRYICFVDSDDYVAKDSLRTCLDIAKSHDLDILGYDMLLTKRTDEITFSSDFCTQNLNVRSGKEYISANKNIRSESCWFFVKQSLLETHDIKFNEARFHMDALFTFECFLKAERVLHVPLSVYRYFQSENSIMRTRTKRHQIKRIENTKIMVSELSLLINEAEEEQVSNAALATLRFKRDSFLFFHLVRIFKTAKMIKLREFSADIKLLKKLNAYPFYSFIGAEHNSFTYKVLNYVFNHTILLFPAFIASKLIARFQN